MCQRPLDSHWAIWFQVLVGAAWAGASTTAAVPRPAKAAAATEMSMRKRMRTLHAPSELAVGFGRGCARPPGHGPLVASPRGPRAARPVGGFPDPVLEAQGTSRPDRTRRDREGIPFTGTLQPRQTPAGQESALPPDGGPRSREAPPDGG